MIEADANILSTIKDGIVVLGKPNCHPCKFVKMFLERNEKEFPDVLVYHVTLTSQIIKDANLFGMDAPIVHVYSNGSVIESKSGFMAEYIVKDLFKKVPKNG